MSPISPVPAFIADRIREVPPLGSMVPGSTPVVAFGDAFRARVATLGLNPSRVEFLDRHGRELIGASRRLETLRSLGVSSLVGASDEVVARVVDGCDRYFQREPYRRWFDQLELVLGGVGASYYDGSACHLDLVQWATDPVWAGLSSSNRRALVRRDWPFLEQQLRNESLEVLFLNGRAVVDAFVHASGRALDPVAAVEVGSVRCRVLVGDAFGMRVVGWSTNLQSSFGVSAEFRAELRDRVASHL